MFNTISDKYLMIYFLIAERFNKFKHSEKGVTAVEYAIVIAGVAAVVAVIFGTDGEVSTLLKGIFSGVTTEIGTSMGITIPAPAPAP